MKKKFIPILFSSMFLSFTLLSQQIRIKKDIVFVDKQELFRIISDDSGDKASWAVLSMDYDTLVKIKGIHVEFEKLPHERIDKYFNYHEIHFAKSNKKRYREITRIGMRKFFVNYLVLNQLIDKEGYNIEKENTKNDTIGDLPNTIPQLIEDAKMRRSKLSQQEEKPVLIERYASVLPRIDKDRILILHDEFIGTAKIENTGYGTSCRVFGGKGEPIATFFNKNGESRVYIHTARENVEIEYHMNGQFIAEEFMSCVELLLMFGCL